MHLPRGQAHAWDLLRFHCNAALMQSDYWLSSLIVPHSTAALWGQGLCPTRLEKGWQVLPEESGEAVLPDRVAGPHTQGAPLPSLPQPWHQSGRGGGGRSCPLPSVEASTWLPGGPQHRPLK